MKCHIWDDGLNVGIGVFYKNCRTISALFELSATRGQMCRAMFSAYEHEGL